MIQEQPMLSRRNWLKLAAAAGSTPLVAGLSAVSAQGQTGGSTDLRIGVQRGAIGAMKVGLAEVQSTYGLRYDQRTFNDATAVILAMAQKELDLGNVTAQHVVRAIDQGIELSVVVGFGGGFNVMLTNPDISLAKNDVAGFTDLAHKRLAQGNRLKIGVPTGSQQHLKLITFLKNQKMDPDKDVDIVNVTFPEHVRALDGRQVDVVLTLSSFAALAIDKGAGKLFQHIYGPGYGRWELGFAVRNDLIRDKPEVVQKSVNSFVGAMKVFSTDMPKRIAYEQRESSFPPGAVALEQREFVQLTSHIVVDDIKRTAKEMAEAGWTKRDLSDQVEKYVNFSFLTKTTGQSEAQLRTF
jgi:NitT/TauT family transport system substrate-binding protein